MSYVLRQIHPPGMSARADEATAPALATAAIRGNVVYGAYLEWSDANANDGKGADGWTDDLGRAKRFPSFQAAVAHWQTQSTIRPLRPDGRPNRPLTAYSVYPERLD